MSVENLGKIGIDCDMEACNLSTSKNMKLTKNGKVFLKVLLIYNPLNTQFFMRNREVIFSNFGTRFCLALKEKKVWILSYENFNLSFQILTRLPFNC